MTYWFIWDKKSWSLAKTSLGDSCVALLSQDSQREAKDWSNSCLYSRESGSKTDTLPRWFSHSISNAYHNK